MKHAHSLSAAVMTFLVRGVFTAVTSGEFSVLTMNVAGLPAILNPNDVPGDKATNAQTIGSKFAQYKYDVIHVQEDFNYHAYIYETDNHPYRTSTSGGVPFGSGLNTLSNFPFIDFRRIKWSTCSDASGSDCLTPKGFTFMRVSITPPTSTTTAVYADFYNLHADAGTEANDLTARQANINQVASYISTWSTGNAVLVFGDTNSRYSRTQDSAIRSLLSLSNPSGPGLSDPWLQLYQNNLIPADSPACGNPASSNTCEIVDKLFYRSSPLLTLTPSAFTYASAQFLQPDGVSILSDHNPVLVNFTWSSSSSSSKQTLQQSPLYGGPHGTWFSDVPLLSSLSKPKPTTLTFRGGSRLDAVSLTLSTGATIIHGGTGGSASTLTLAASEYWTSGELCQGQKDGQTRIFYIRAVTSTGRSLAVGTKTADCVTYSAPGSGWQIVGFLGQDGDEVDQLGFVYGLR